jgi:hypothetical protein
LGGRLDVDGVDPGAELVYQPQSSRAQQVGARKRPEHMPYHFGVGQFPIERGLRIRSVVVGAPTDVKPISFRREEIEHLRSGKEMGEDP